jgi:type II secretory pathway pseudopilin PulG
VTRRRSAIADGGFTLLETIVGLTIVLIVTASLVPLLITGALASRTGKLSTEAKNIAIKQLDAMRSLPYHVAAQNGPFVDVLDEYYVNTSSTTITIPTTGGTGKYVASGKVPGQSANSAYYVVSFTSGNTTNPLPTGFTQTVYTQFLSPNSTGGPTPTGDKVITPTSSYNNNNPSSSQTDAPPSSTIGITAVTTYSVHGKVHTYRVYTELADNGHDSPLVVAESGAEALHVSSSAYDGTSLDAIIGEIGQSASLSHVSTAFDSVVSGQFTRTDPTGVTTYAPILVGNASTTAPPNTSPPLSGSSTNCSISDTGPVCGGNNCGWGWIGDTSYTDVGATVANAQPRVPQDVEQPSSTQFAVKGNNASACGGVGFTNVLPSSPSPNPALYGFSSSNPILSLLGTSSTTLFGGSAKIDTPALSFSDSGSTANPVVSSANLSFGGPIYLFPGMSFVTDNKLPSGAASNGALIAIEFTSPVSISCNAQQQNATASYAGKLDVWEQPTSSGGGAGYVAIPFSFNNGSPTVLPSPSSINVTWNNGSAVPLSSYIANWNTGNIVQQAPAAGATNSNVGVHTIPEAISIVTQPVLTDSTGAVDTDTSVIANVGNVSCVSEDFR